MLQVGVSFRESRSPVLVRQEVKLGQDLVQLGSLLQVLLRGPARININIYQRWMDMQTP